MVNENISGKPVHEELAAELRNRTISNTKSESAFSALKAGEIFQKLIAEQKVIYGVDNRVDLYHVTDREVLDNADSVVAIFDVSQIASNGDGTSNLITIRYKDAHNLCESEPFFNQPSGPNCTGFLVAPNIIATAGHCITNSNFLRKRFVFGFQMKNERDANLTVPDADIYQALAVIDRVEESDGADYALIRLNRPVPDHKIVQLSRRNRVADNERLYVIGHPAGLPKKYADGAIIRDNTASSYFVANLDTYGGNSGSPVFNMRTDEVEGILVRGENDFITVGTCTRSMVCPTTGCRGEDVTRVSEFFNKIPKQTDIALSLEERVLSIEASITSFKKDIDELKELIRSKI